FPIALVIILMAHSNTMAQAPSDTVQRAQKFISQHEQRIRPLDIATGLAWWNANITGKDEDFKAKEEAQNKLDQALGDRERFAELKSLHEAKITDPLVKRQIHVLYLMYLEKQVDPELLKRITSKANS